MMISLCTQIAEQVTKLLLEDLPDDIPMTTLNTLCKYSPHHINPTPQIVWSLYFFFDPKKKVYHTTSVANGCSRLWLRRITPLVPPQARASARVLAKHVCQPKSCGCVVNVCCNWEIHVRIPLGWCGGAKEGLRNYEFSGVEFNSECSRAVM